MNESTKGVIAMIVAASIWGFSPILYKALADVPPFEILAHRVIWSFLFLAALLLMRRRLLETLAIAGSSKAMRYLVPAAILVSVNWLLFIYSIQAGRTLEASLGYYIFPLLAVCLGYFFLKEQFSRLQGIAIMLAGIAVLVLSVGVGTLPWIAILLAGSFAGYGFLKRQLQVGPVSGVCIETFLVVPIALIWLVGVHEAGWGAEAGAFGQDWQTSLLLMLSGPVTAIPLMLMSFATRRINFASLGLVQYLNPTLQFLVAVLLFGEVFTSAHGIAFGLIWVGLLLYSTESLRHERTSRKRAASSGTPD